MIHDNIMYPFYLSVNIIRGTPTSLRKFCIFRSVCLSVRLSFRPSVIFSLTRNYFLHSQQIPFKFHAWITLVDISDGFSFGRSATHDFQDSRENGRHSMNFFNPFQSKPWFLRVCSTNSLKTLWEKEKLLVTSNFSFCCSVFYLSEESSVIFIKFKIVVYKLFQFGSA